MLPKILLTAAIIIAVWYGFRIAGKYFGGASAGSSNVKEDTRREKIEDLARCSVCDTFVEAQGVADCKRDDCPMMGTRT
ncbi:MAG: hypothetical protein O3A21_07640 [Proteobacteria bacterium]|nr:hypothetical protein [Pseudomonadota bacterium]